MISYTKLAAQTGYYSAKELVIDVSRLDRWVRQGKLTEWKEYPSRLRFFHKATALQLKANEALRSKPRIPDQMKKEVSAPDMHLREWVKEFNTKNPGLHKSVAYRAYHDLFDKSKVPTVIEGHSDDPLGYNSPYKIYKHLRGHLLNLEGNIQNDLKALRQTLNDIMEIVKHSNHAVSSNGSNALPPSIWPKVE